LTGIISAVRDEASVVFVPGFMQRAAAWSPVAEVVRERYRSSCLDPDTWTFEERLAEIAAAAPPGSVLVGYSLGGRLVLHAALREPERYSALVIVGASAGIEHASERAERRAADEALAAWIEQRPIEEVVDRWEAQHVFSTQARELVAAQRPGRLSHHPRLLARLLRSAGQGTLEPVWDRLAELAPPLLAIAGERDERYAAAARRLARDAPHGEARLVPGAGHAPQLERPREVARLVVQFLDEHLGEGRLVDGDPQPRPLGDPE
jgi:2-succinyl-6-hydroxy-2,4-cyclohexadiene-1-carboxylate synthase